MSAVSRPQSTHLTNGATPPRNPAIWNLEKIGYGTSDQEGHRKKRGTDKLSSNEQNDQACQPLSLRIQVSTIWLVRLLPCFPGDRQHFGVLDCASQLVNP